VVVGVVVTLTMAINRLAVVVLVVIAQITHLLPQLQHLRFLVVVRPLKLL
jgi:hypothetical protein